MTNTQERMLKNHVLNFLISQEQRYFSDKLITQEIEQIEQVEPFDPRELLR